MFDGLLQTAVAEAASEDRSAWSPAARSARLLDLLEARERLEAEVLRCVGEWDAAGAWAEDGACNPVAWLTHQSRLTREDAVKLVRSARLVRDHDQTRQALADGSVSTAHVDLLARAARHREDVYAQHEDVLIGTAASTSPEPFRKVVQQWRVVADQQIADSEANALYLRRHLRLWRTFPGAQAIDGRLDPEGGAMVSAALAALDHPDSKDADLPPRTRAQRLADALVEMAAHSLACKHSRGRSPVGLDVIVDIDTLAGEAPSPVGGRSEIAHVGPVAPRTIQRLACDSAIGRVIMRGKSEVLDLGRRSRVPSEPQRRALVLRDGGCVWPGCRRPPEWCDAHHLVPWTDGGTTDLENLVLLCRRHHVACHEGGWQLTRAPDGHLLVERAPPLAA